MLLSLQDIERRLDEQFRPLEPMLSGLRLVPRLGPDTSLDRCEAELGVIFPASFRRIVNHYDFGRLTIGPMVFCNTGNYGVCMSKSNTPAPFLSPWWGEGTRPLELVMIGNAEFRAIVIDTVRGHLLAFEHGRPWRETSVRVARDAELFLRALGTVFIQRQEMQARADLTQAIAYEAGAEGVPRFWKELAA